MSLSKVKISPSELKSKSYELRKPAATSLHTTHEPLSAKIEYRHHPCYGMEIRVVRTRRRGPEAIDIVQRSDGLQIAVPRWMLDPLACQQLPQEAKPRVALRALVRLAELVRTRDLPVGAEASVLGVSPPTQDHHASKENPTLLSTAITAAQENALAPVPRSDSRSVSSVVGPTASASSGHNRSRKERP